MAALWRITHLVVVRVRSQNANKGMQLHLVMLSTSIVKYAFSGCTRKPSAERMQCEM